MTSRKVLALYVFLALAITVALAGGKRDFEEECTISGQIKTLFSDDEADKNACNTDKRLVCGLGGKCGCLPGFTFEKTGFLGLFGGECLIKANFPCSGENAACVSNAGCRDSASICRCVEGYHESDGHCSNGGNQIVFNGLYVFGLLASYFLLAH